MVYCGNGPEYYRILSACHKTAETIVLETYNVVSLAIELELQCNQAREQNFLKPYFWAKTYTDKPT